MRRLLAFLFPVFLFLPRSAGAAEIYAEVAVSGEGVFLALLRSPTDERTTLEWVDDKKKPLPEDKWPSCPNVLEGRPAELIHRLLTENSPYAIPEEESPFDRPFTLSGRGPAVRWLASGWFLRPNSELAEQLGTVGRIRLEFSANQELEVIRPSFIQTSKTAAFFQEGPLTKCEFRTELIETFSSEYNLLNAIRPHEKAFEEAELESPFRRFLFVFRMPEELGGKVVRIPLREVGSAPPGKVRVAIENHLRKRMIHLLAKPNKGDSTPTVSVDTFLFDIFDLQMADTKSFDVGTARFEVLSRKIHPGRQRVTLRLTRGFLTRLVFQDLFLKPDKTRISIIDFFKWGLLNHDRLTECAHHLIHKNLLQMPPRNNP